MVEQRDLLKTNTAANSRTAVEDGALERRYRLPDQVNDRDFGGSAWSLHHHPARGARHRRGRCVATPIQVRLRHVGRRRLGRRWRRSDGRNHYSSTIWDARRRRATSEEQQEHDERRRDDTDLGSLHAAAFPHRRRDRRAPRSRWPPARLAAKRESARSTAT